MTDKTKKDFCRDCSVEPPAMKFKCPQCEHNPDKEQIIINDVNVGGCNNALQGKNTVLCADSEGRALCDSNANCYYKQLARKTQECEELKEKYEALKLENQEGYEIVDELKQECEDLKKQLIQKDEINTFFNTPIEGWSSDPCNVCEYKGENTRYLKALEEIKEITKPFCNACQEFEPERKGRNCMYCNYGKILDIIKTIDK